MDNDRNDQESNFDREHELPAARLAVLRPFIMIFVTTSCFMPRVHLRKSMVPIFATAGAHNHESDASLESSHELKEHDPIRAMNICVISWPRFHSRPLLLMPSLITFVRLQALEAIRISYLDIVL